MKVCRSLTALLLATMVLSSLLTSSLYASDDENSNNPATGLERTEKSAARQYLKDKNSADPLKEKKAHSKVFGQWIAQDLDSEDQDRIDDAIKVLKERKIKQPGLCRIDILPHVFSPLLDRKEFDLLQNLLDEGCSDAKIYEETEVVAQTQERQYRLLLATGKYDRALVAAKQYYNVCRLPITQHAIEVVVEALANAKRNEGVEIVKRFREEQESGMASATDNDGKASAGAMPDTILCTIKIDPKPFDSLISTLKQLPVNFKNLRAKGNLLLLADRADEAVEAFKQASDVAGNDEDLQSGIECVARALRAKAGNVAAANAYILSLRKGAK